MYLHPKKSWQVVKLIKSSKLPENYHGNESADHFTSSFQERLPWVRKANRNKFRFQNTYQLEIHTAHKCIKCNFRWFIKHEKKKNQACAFILMNGLTFLFTVWFNKKKKKSDWTVTEIAEARHMKENADKHVTLLVFYLVLGIFSWPNDAKKNLILSIVNFSRYSSDICLKIQMLKPSSASLMLLPVSQCFK